MVYATGYIKKIPAVICLILLFACAENPLGIEKNVNILEENSLEFTTLVKTSRDVTYKKSIFEVIESKEEEKAVFADILISGGNGKLVPFVLEGEEVDYAGEILIVICPGEQSSGSNEIGIVSVYDNSGVLYVRSELFIPETGTADMGYPCHIIKMRRQEKEIRFLDPDTVYYGSGNREIKFTTITENELKFTVETNTLFSVRSQADIQKAKSQYPGLFSAFDGTVPDFLSAADLGKETVAGIALPPFYGHRKAYVKSIRQFGGKVHIYTVEEVHSLQTEDTSYASHIVRFEKTQLPIVFEPTEVRKLYKEQGELPFYKIWNMRNSFFVDDTLAEVITTKEQQDTLFMKRANLNQMSGFPKVDYSKYDAVCIALPKEGGEATYVSVEKVFRKKGVIYVQPVRHVASQTQGVKNYPCVVLLIEKSGLPVKILGLKHKQI